MLYFVCLMCLLHEACQYQRIKALAIHFDSVDDCLSYTPVFICCLCFILQVISFKIEAAWTRFKKDGSAKLMTFGPVNAFH